MSKQQTTTDELFASNKQLNVKINQLTKKIDQDNKEILTNLKELNSSINMLILQSRKISEKVGENEKTNELFEIMKVNRQNINDNITKLNNKF